MLAVEINRANYEYDIHSIVKAFYPEKTVKILTPETKEDKRAQMEADVHLWVNLTDEGAEVVADARLAGESMDAAEAGDAQEAGVKDAQDTETEGVEAMGAVKAEDTQPAAFSWQYDAQNETQESYKDGFKRFLYRSLSRLTGKELPWGNLTGIRPTKIAYGMLEEGRSEEEIMDYLEKSHFVSKEKGQLSIGIAKREREILSDIHYEGGYSLYIGIPFCPTTCLYCSFTSLPSERTADRWTPMWIA